MNILVTGSNGQLGREMRRVSVGTGDAYTFTDVVSAEGLETELLDITDPEAVRLMVKSRGIRCIVNCAAYTNVDKAESDEALCRRLNAEAPGILADAMKEAGGLLVQISTDYVFGADPYNTPCREDQTGTPTGVYGMTKLEGDFVIIRISDTGTGIAENEIQKIFEPYFTTKASGTGLGLTVVYKVIKEHRGDIFVSSQEGKGTSFTIKLPVPSSQRRAIENKEK